MRMVTRLMVKNQKQKIIFNTSTVKEIEILQKIVNISAISDSFCHFNDLITFIHCVMFGECLLKLWQIWLDIYMSLIVFSTLQCSVNMQINICLSYIYFNIGFGTKMVTALHLKHGLTEIEIHVLFFSTCFVNWLIEWMFLDVQQQIFHA